MLRVRNGSHACHCCSMNVIFLNIYHREAEVERFFPPKIEMQKRYEQMLLLVIFEQLPGGHGESAFLHFACSGKHGELLYAAKVDA